MSSRISLARELGFPVDLVTQAIAILAMRRAGKSFTARRLVEQLFGAGLQTVVADPKGDWWGLRSSVDGKRPGLPIVIAGGEHGDVPLEAGGGEILAKLVVEQRVNVLLDLSLLRKSEVAHFMTDFLETLYRLKAREAYRTPMMLVIDEADAIAPQKPMKGEERMLGAANDIVRRGGQRGIGCTLITQRSAVINKNVLTQAQVLIALRTIAAQDRAAIEAWIEVHGTAEQGRVLMDSLPALPTGDAWVWSPGWPTSAGIFQRIHVDPIETFDSGATPKPGEKRIEPKNLADVDLEALRKQMAATIERAAAEDPKKLRAEIAKLKRELAAKPAAAPPAPAKPKIERVEVPVISEAAFNRLEKVAARCDQLADGIRKLSTDVKHAAAKIEAAAGTGPRFGPHRGVGTVLAHDHRASGPKATPAPRRAVDATVGGMTPARQRILDALAWLDAVGIPRADRTQLALLAKQSPASSGYSNNLGGLRTAGLIDYPEGGKVQLTAVGAEVASAPDAPPTADDLHRQLREILPPARWRIVESLIRHYPDAVERERLAELAGQSPGSSGYSNNLGALRSLGLIDYASGGRVVARPVLFLESA